MPALVAFPTVVTDALAIFGDVFDTEPARHHGAAYLTGLMVAAHKTVSGSNRACAVTTDQSCLHRWLTAVAWGVKALNARRWAWVQGDPKRRDSARGMMAIDHTLVDHPGKRIEDVGWCWDHAHERSVIAHDDLISNNVCPAGAHDPIAWRRLKKREACAVSACKEHTQLCPELVDAVITRSIPGDCIFDRYCTSAKVLNHMQGTKGAYVGDMQLHRKVVYDGREPSLQAVARQMPWQAQKPVRVGTRRYWYCRKQMSVLCAATARGHPRASCRGDGSPERV